MINLIMVSPAPHIRHILLNKLLGISDKTHTQWSKAIVAQRLELIKNEIDPSGPNLLDMVSNCHKELSRILNGLMDIYVVDQQRDNANPLIINSMNKVFAIRHIDCESEIVDHYTSSVSQINWHERHKTVDRLIKDGRSPAKRARFLSEIGEYIEELELTLAKEIKSIIKEYKPPLDASGQAAMKYESWMEGLKESCASIESKLDEIRAQMRMKEKYAKVPAIPARAK